MGETVYAFGYRIWYCETCKKEFKGRSFWECYWCEMRRRAAQTSKDNKDGR